LKTKAKCENFCTIFYLLTGRTCVSIITSFRSSE